MHIRSFHIEQFGILHDIEVNELPKISVFYGQNEAGKSTLLEFFRGVLTGFPSLRTSEGKSYLATTRHGGTLCFEEQGKLFRLSRHFGVNKGLASLFDEEGQSLPIDAFERLMQGVDRKIYSSIYGFSLGELQNVATLTDKGMRNALYGASFGLGLQDPQSIFGQFQSKREEIYRPKGQKHECKALFDECEEIDKEIAQISEKMAQYDALYAKCNEQQEEYHFLRTKHQEQERERRQIQRRLEAWDQWAKWQGLCLQLERLNSPASDNALQKNKRILPFAGEIQLLQEHKHSLRTALEELPTLALQKEACTEEIHRRLQALGGFCSFESIVQKRQHFQDISSVQRGEACASSMQETFTLYQRQEKLLESSLEACHEAEAFFEESKAQSKKEEGLENDQKLAKEALLKTTLNAQKKAKKPQEPTFFFAAAFVFVLLAVACVFLTKNTQYLHALPYNAWYAVATCAVAVFLCILGFFQRQSLRAWQTQEASAQAFEDFLQKQAKEQERLHKQQAQEKVQQAELAFKKASLRYQEAKQEYERLHEKHRQALASWQAHLQSLGLPTDLSPQAASQAKAHISALLGSLDEEAKFDKHIEHHTRQLEGFETQLKQLTEKLGKDFFAQELFQQGSFDSFLPALDSLHKSLEKAKKDDEELRNLVAKKDMLEDDLRLRSLQYAASSEDKEAKELSKEAYFALFLDSFLRMDKDNLAMQLAEIKEKETELQAQYEKAGQEAHLLQNNLQELRASTRLAKLRNKRQGLCEKLAQLGKRWAAYVLAEKVFLEAKKTFEKEQQPAVMKRASQIFESISGGTWKQVITSLDDASLSVIGAGGAPLTSESLSRGSQEQVYLALRLAHIRNHAAQAVALPIILDDIFVNFDSNRRQRSLHSLEEMSQKYVDPISGKSQEGHQILLFTCHEHIVEELQKNLPKLGLYLEKGRIVN